MSVTVTVGTIGFSPPDMPATTGSNFGTSRVSVRFSHAISTPPTPAALMTSASTSSIAAPTCAVPMVLFRLRAKAETACDACGLSVDSRISGVCE
jgi:hypothetical protein